MSMIEKMTGGKGLYNSNYSDYNNHDNRYNNHDNYRHNNDYDKNKPYYNSRVAKIFNNRGYSLSRCSPDKLKSLLINDGLETMVDDLKGWREDKKPRPEYAQNAISDLGFAGNINKVFDKISFKNKDMIYLYEEILSFIINNQKIKTQLNSDIYSDDTLNDMCNEYQKLLVRVNKKRIKKISKKLKMNKTDAEHIAVLSTNKSLKGIYNLLDYIYYHMALTNSTVFTKSYFKNLFKVCFGKKAYIKVISKLMMENYKRMYFKKPEQQNVWDTLTSLMLDEIEKQNVKNIYKTLKYFVNQRCRNELKHKASRRFRDSDITKENYPKLRKALNNLKANDIMMKRFL